MCGKAGEHHSGSEPQPAVTVHRPSTAVSLTAHVEVSNGQLVHSKARTYHRSPDLSRLTRDPFSQIKTTRSTCNTHGCSPLQRTNHAPRQKRHCHSCDRIANLGFVRTHTAFAHTRRFHTPPDARYTSSPAFVSKERERPLPRWPRPRTRPSRRPAPDEA